MQIQDGRAPTSYPNKYCVFFIEAPYGPILHQSIMIEASAHFFWLRWIGGLLFSLQKVWVVTPLKNELQRFGAWQIEKGKNKGGPPKHGLYGVLLPSPGENLMPRPLLNIHQLINMVKAISWITTSIDELHVKWVEITIQLSPLQIM